MREVKGITLDGLLNDRTRTYGEKTLVSFRQKRVLSYEGLRRESTALGLKLASRGVKPGERIGLVLANDLAIAEVLWASLWLRAIPVIINCSHGVQKISHLLKEADVNIAVVEQEKVPSLSTTWKKLQPKAGLFWWEELERFNETSPDVQEDMSLGQQAIADQSKPESLALITFTSGSSGCPKLVRFTHEQLLASAVSIATWLHLDEEDCLITPLSLNHVNVLVVGLLASLWVGGSMIISNSWFHHQNQENEVDGRTSWVLASPDLIAQATLKVNLAPRTPGDQPWRFVLSMGAPLPKIVQEKFEKIFYVPLINAYSLTETAGIACCNPVPEVKREDPQVWARRCGTVGKPVGCEVKIINASGYQAQGEEIGEVLLHSTFSNSDIEGDGETISTGDLGYVDNNDYVYLVARSSEVINLNGSATYPWQLEERLLSLQGVQDASVLCVPDPIQGGKTVAYIVAKDATIAERLSLALLGASDIEIKICNWIPRTILGKADKTRMVKEYLKEM